MARILLHQVWSEREIEQLKALAGTMPAGRIAAKLRRSEDGVSHQAAKLGISLKLTKPYEQARSKKPGLTAGLLPTEQRETAH